VFAQGQHGGRHMWGCRPFMACGSGCWPSQA
jgi:hypothetical protein